MESLAGARVLVTGSAGVIGRQLLPRLERAGAELLSVDRESLPGEQFSSIRHIRLDLADDGLSLLRSFEPETVLHLAAAFERSKESPGFWPFNWHDNMVCSHRIVDLATRMTSLKAFVFASSYLIYDPDLYLTLDANSPAVPLAENDRQSTRNVTGAAKLYTEAELDFLGEYVHSDLRIVNARIFRSYGRGSRDIVSRWVRAAIAREDIELYNPDNRFDYVFADDVAEGLMRMAADTSAEGVINLATGTARSVRDLVAAVDAEFPGFAGRVEDRGTIEAYEHSRADVTRLRDTLGWTPVTTLEEGVRMIATHERLRSEGSAE
jgi:nucleoside-diphosphate-sugar epimerase